MILDDSHVAASPCYGFPLSWRSKFVLEVPNREIKYYWGNLFINITLCIIVAIAIVESYKLLTQKIKT